MRPMRAWMIAGAAASALVLSACGEREQASGAGDTASQTRSYQGKPDQKPWDNEPLAHGAGGFERGDRAGWERALRDRAQAQNEYNRTR